jgi:hypothetical protein
VLLDRLAPTSNGTGSPVYVNINLDGQALTTRVSASGRRLLRSRAVIVGGRPGGDDVPAGTTLA